MRLPPNLRIGLSNRIAYLMAFLLAAVGWAYLSDAGFFIALKPTPSNLAVFGGHLVAALVAVTVSVACIEDLSGFSLQELIRYWALPLVGPVVVLETAGLMLVNPIQALLWLTSLLGSPSLFFLGWMALGLLAHLLAITAGLLVFWALRAFRA